jgi:hypothetical protein
MSASQEQQPTLDSVAPRFLVGDMEQALAFYGQLGFVTPYHDEGFAILERDRIALQFNVSDPTQEPPMSMTFCWSWRTRTFHSLRVFWAWIAGAGKS